MPDLTITLTTAQTTRVAAALSRLNGGAPATAAQITAWLLAQLRAEVSAAARVSARTTADAQATTDLTAEGWAP